MLISKTKMPSAITEHHILGYMEWGQCDTWHSGMVTTYHPKSLLSMPRPISRYANVVDKTRFFFFFFDKKTTNFITLTGNTVTNHSIRGNDSF